MKKQFYVIQYAAIFNSENKLLLLKDAENKEIKGKWVFPGGHIDSDKDATAALAREVLEETNLRITASWTFRTTIKKYPDGNLRFVVYYVCHTKGNVKLSQEHDMFDWIDLEKAKRLSFRDKEEKEIILELIKRKNG